MHLLRAQIAFASRRGSDAPELLLKAARRTGGGRPRTSRARPTWRLCPLRCSLAGWPARRQRGGDQRGCAGRPAAAPAAASIRPAPPGVGRSLHRWVRGGAPDPEETRLPRSVQRPYCRPRRPVGSGSPAGSRSYLWDDEAWTVLSTRHARSRPGGRALTALPFVLTNRSSVYAFFGELGEAEAYEEELRAATERDRDRHCPIRCARDWRLVRGREAELSELIRTSVKEAEARRRGPRADDHRVSRAERAVQRARPVRRGARPRLGEPERHARRARRSGP